MRIVTQTMFSQHSEGIQAPCVLVLYPLKQAHALDVLELLLASIPADSTLISYFHSYFLAVVLVAFEF